MMYFKNVTSYENLKKQFRELLKANHPDNGGNAETMKEINCEYDALFKIWKDRHEKTTGEKVQETAESTRNQFYTQFGWEGKNHDFRRSLKEVAQIVRAYVKEKYPTYKFSVRTSYASMCQELHVELKESPVEIYKNIDELTEDDRNELHRKLYKNGIFTKSSWYDEELTDAIKKAWEECGNGYYKVINDITKTVINDVDAFVKSYNYEDCDGGIDYFDVDFYYFGCCSGNGENIKIVPKTARINKKTETIVPAETKKEDPAGLPEEYSITESRHTKTGEKIWLVKIIRTLSREEYIKENQKMKNLKGYYSKFTHSFIFNYNPTDALQTV